MGILLSALSKRCHHPKWNTAFRRLISSTLVFQRCCLPIMLCYSENTANYGFLPFWRLGASSVEEDHSSPPPPTPLSALHTHTEKIRCVASMCNNTIVSWTSKIRAEDHSRPLGPWENIVHVWPSLWLGTLLIPHNELADRDCQHDLIIPAEQTVCDELCRLLLLLILKAWKVAACNKRALFTFSLHASFIRRGRTTTTIKSCCLPGGKYKFLRSSNRTRKCKSCSVSQVYPNYIHVLKSLKIGILYILAKCKIKCLVK